MQLDYAGLVCMQFVHQFSMNMRRTHDEHSFSTHSTNIDQFILKKAKIEGKGNFTLKGSLTVKECLKYHG